MMRDSTVFYEAWNMMQLSLSMIFQVLRDKEFYPEKFLDEIDAAHMKLFNDMQKEFRNDEK